MAGGASNFISESVFNVFQGASLGYNVLAIIIVLTLFSLFIFKFYKSISKRNLIELNLMKYNFSHHPLTSKFFAIILYLLEYIIIMPFLIGLWFTGFAIIILLVGSGIAVSEVLLISASLIGAIRILAYINGEVATDLAKLFPFMTVSFFLLSPGLFDKNKIWAQILEIPSLFDSLLSFILVIFLVEIALRFIYTIYDFWKSEDDNVRLS